MAKQRNDVINEVKRRVVQRFWITILITFAVFVLFGIYTYVVRIENSDAVKYCRIQGTFIQEYTNCQTSADFFSAIMVGLVSGLGGTILMGLPLGFVTSRMRKWKLYGYIDTFNSIAEPISWVVLVLPLFYYSYGAGESEIVERINSGMPEVLVVFRLFVFYGLFLGTIAYNNAMKKRHAADLDAGIAPVISIELSKPATPKEKYAGYLSDTAIKDIKGKKEDVLDDEL